MGITFTISLLDVMGVITLIAMAGCIYILCKKGEEWGPADAWMNAIAIALFVMGFALGASMGLRIEGLL